MDDIVVIEVPQGTNATGQKLQDWLNLQQNAFALSGKKAISITTTNVGGGLEPLLQAYIFLLEDLGGERDA
jgi:hypothetical protein